MRPLFVTFFFRWYVFFFFFCMAEKWKLSCFCGGYMVTLVYEWLKIVSNYEFDVCLVDP
jgi:hypothetical protein